MMTKTAPPPVRVLQPLTLAVAFLATTSLAVAGLANSAKDTTPLKAGEKVPAANLRTVDGKSLSLQQVTAGRPTILVYYRGGWCPFCNRHLAEIQGALKDLEKLGYQVLAISPDGPEALKATAAKRSLEYTLLSDARMEASDAFGLAFRLDDATLRRYEDYGIKLTAKHDGAFWLPVPAVYVVDASGTIRFAYANPDYKVRLEASKLIQAARAASKSQS